VIASSEICILFVFLNLNLKVIEVSGFGSNRSVKVIIFLLSVKTLTAPIGFSQILCHNFPHSLLSLITDLKIQRIGKVKKQNKNQYVVFRAKNSSKFYSLDFCL